MAYHKLPCIFIHGNLWYAIVIHTFTPNMELNSFVAMNTLGRSTLDKWLFVKSIKFESKKKNYQLSGSDIYKLSFSEIHLKSRISTCI